MLSNTIRLWAGAERFALDAARGLRARGHTVSLQAYPGHELHRRASAAGIPVMGTRVRGDWAPWTLAPLAVHLWRHPVDLVWTMREKDLRNLALAAHLSPRRIAVIHSRECDEAIKDKGYNRWFHRRVADTLVVNSRATRATTLASAPWLDPDRVELLPKGIEIAPWRDVDPGDWPARLGLREGEVLIGYAGQLVPRKRLDLLLRLLARAPLRPRRWRLALAGTGPQEAKLRALAQELGIAERVVFCGFVPGMPEWMAALDLFALPSRVEGFGYVLAEAMAAGVPIVAFDASSVPEVVTRDESALLASPDDEDSFATQLLRLVDDRELRRRLGAHGREEAQRRHSLERMIDTMEGILYRTVDARGTRTTRGSA
jgi:glycosyltransferase involved in cell wall biosynthesis